MLDVLCPRRCGGCDEALARQRIGLCAVCAETLLEAPPLPRPPAPIHALHVPFAYGGQLAVWLQRLKYDRREDLAHGLGQFVGPALRQAADAQPGTVVVPVPSHWTTRLWRGMDHTATLARSTSVRWAPAARKIRRTRRQAGLGRQARQHNLRGAFAAAWVVRHLRGRPILLVDDVLTTGATLEAVASALAAAGVGPIAAFAVAYKDDAPPLGGHMG